MKFNLASNFTRNTVSKILEKIIRNKLGYNVDILLNNLSVEIVDGDLKAATNVEIRVNREELAKIVKTIVE